MSAWEVKVRGDDFVVSIERGESGKDFIRVNGRLAAVPMVAADLERGFSIAGVWYVIRRDGESYQLLRDDLEATPDSPSARWTPRRFLTGLVFVGVAVLLLLWGRARFYERRASDRVNRQDSPPPLLRNAAMQPNAFPPSPRPTPAPKAPTGDPNPKEKETKAVQPSRILIQPGTDLLSQGNLCLMDSTDQYLMLHAYNRTQNDGDEVTFLVITAIQRVPQVDRGDFVIDAGSQPLHPGIYTTGSRPSSGNVRFTMTLNGRDCVSEKGTLELLDLSYDMGERNYLTGNRYAYVKRLNAKFSVQCYGSAAPTQGEIHIVSETQ